MAALNMLLAPETARPLVRPARWNDHDRVVGTLTRAFAADPAARWMYPDEEQFRRYFPLFVRAFGGGALERGTAFVSGHDLGAALWLPPDSASDEDGLTALLEESIAESEKDDAFAVFEEMGRYHPGGPHWHLALVGVVPEEQGLGHGGAMLRHSLRLCDQTGLPAYLESSNPRNVPLYRRHGFEVIGEIRIGRCPPIIPMLRPARN